MDPTQTTQRATAPLDRTSPPGPGPRRPFNFPSIERLALPNGLPVLMARTDGLPVKEALVATYPDVFFTIPHFDGYPAVLVRLDAIDVDHLREVITDAWLLKAGKRAGQAWLSDHPPGLA